MIEWRSQNIRSWTINNSAATAQWHNLLCSLLDTAASKHRVTDRPPASQLASDKPSPDPAARLQLRLWLLPRPGDQHSTKMAMLGTTLMSGMMSHSEAEKMFRPWWDNMRYEHRQSRGLYGTSTYSQSLVWILCYSKNSTFEVEELNYQGQTNLLPWDKNLSNLIRKIFIQPNLQSHPSKKMNDIHLKCSNNTGN